MNFVRGLICRLSWLHIWASDFTLIFNAIHNMEVHEIGVDSMKQLRERRW